MKYFIFFLWIAIILYIVACFLLYRSQEDIIFLGAKNSDISITSSVQEITLETEGIQLSWYKKDIGSAMTTLYFGWNAEDVRGIFGRNIFSWNTIAFNYRSYGKSGWKPSEEKLFQDALFIYDSMIASWLIFPNKTVIVGRSLWTGIASYLATKRQIQKLILITPYDSMESLAKANYPYFPISILLKHKFNTQQIIQGYTGKVLFIIAENDSVIPYWHSQELINATQTEKNVVHIKWATHNSILSYSGALQEINNFIY